MSFCLKNLLFCYYVFNLFLCLKNLFYSPEPNRCLSNALLMRSQEFML